MALCGRCGGSKVSAEENREEITSQEIKKLDEIKRQRELKVLTDNLNLYKYLNIDKLLKNTKRLFKGKKALSFSKKDEKSSESVLEFAVKCIKDNWKIKEYRNLIKALIVQSNQNSVLYHNLKICQLFP